MFRVRSPQHRELALFELFAGCTADQIDAIERLGTEVAVRNGTTVWREDRTEPQFVMVLDGQIELTRAGNHATTLTPGTWFGHVALLAHLPAEQVSGVVAAGSTPTRLFAFSKRQFASLLHAAPTVAASLQHAAASTTQPSLSRDELEPVETGPAALAANHSIARAATATTPTTRSSRNATTQELDRAPAAQLTQGGIR